MFSFHKPKIYRSLSGCCICKAKSSSSRFTDSKKYEPEFEKCFKIIEKRSGEICNACVLLVKRWKKLPSNTTRDWHHVVDARAGPGTKSIKSKQNITDSLITSTTTSLNHRRHRKSKISTNCIRRVSDPIEVSPDASDSSDMEEDNDDIDDIEEEMELQKNNKKRVETCESRAFGGNTCDKSRLDSTNNRNKDCESPTNTGIISFVDTTFWKKEKICCGIIFKGPDNEVLIYPKLLEPCYCRRNNKSDRIEAKMTSIIVAGSDSSSVGSSLAEEDGNSNASSGNTSLT